MQNKPLVSVIIPTKNSESTIGACLKSIRQQTYKNIEIIVVDNNSTDKTKEIARKYTKLVFNKGPERSAQRNFGALKSKGNFLLFIDSDMKLSNAVVVNCIRQVESYNVHKVLGGIIIPEESFGEGFWAKCKALERSFYFGVDWIEAPRFFSKVIFNKFKGYDEKQTGTEDYDLPQRIKTELGQSSILRIKNLIYHNEGKLQLGYTLKKKYYYAKTAGAYISKKSNMNYFRKQSSIVERYKLFLSHPVKLFKNPIVGIGMLFMKTSELIVGGIGILHAKANGT
jgi:glycosyltransferase involved in cell wall biosynthesis